MVIIDTSYTLQKAIENSPSESEVVITGKDEILEEFFRSIDSFGSLTHLTVKVSKFLPIYQNQLIELIKRGLKHLHIQAQIIDELNLLVDNLYFYSSLEHLEIIANRYTELSSLYIGKSSTPQQQYNGSKMKEEVNKKCCAIVKLNKEVKIFLLEELPNLAKKIKELNFSQEIPVKDFDEQQTRFAVDIGAKYSKFNELEKFHRELNKNGTFKTVQRLACEWNIEVIVSKNDISRFKIMKDFFPSFDINRQFSPYGNGFERLIDIATYSQSVYIIKALISLGADLTCISIDNPMLEPSPFDRDFPTNFPFLSVMRGGNECLKKLFLNNEKALYDGLAWLIYINNGVSLEILKQVKLADLDMNKTIPDGLFHDFTLLQLMIIYRRTELLLECLKNQTEAELIKLANQIHPNRQNFQYSEWSVLAVIIYQGQHNELATFSEKISLDQTTLKSSRLNNAAIQLLLDGACRASRSTTLCFHDTLADYAKCLTLLKGNFSKIVMEDLRFYDSENESELPLLHFAIFNKIFSVIKSDIQDISHNKLQERTYMKGLKIPGETNPLELAVLVESGSDIVEFLFDLYERKNLLSVLVSPSLCLNGMDLFQYSFLSKELALFKRFVKWEGCRDLINSPFPHNHPEYPGWLPIHVIILLALIGLPERLKTLLQSSIFQNLDIKVPFPEQGKPHFLTEHYPTSALFYPGNPVKTGSSAFLNPLRLSGYFVIFLALIDNLKKEFPTTRKKILNQALFYALVYHDIKSYNDNSEAIGLLVEHEANPYQSYGTEGALLIDLAKERGLLHLFPDYLEEQTQTLIRQVVPDPGNRRASELQRFVSYELMVDDDYSVVALLRNVKSSSKPEHVFIVVDRIIKGRSVILFIDFVIDENKPGKGKIRYELIRGRLNESLLERCPLTKIKDVDDLVCLPPWRLTNEACEKLFIDISKDKNREEGQEIDYVAAGNRSIITRSSGGKGHSCYTWAREKLLATEDQRIEQDLKPTFEEWLGTLPSLKDQPWYKNSFVRRIAVAGALSTVGIFALVKGYSYAYSKSSCVIPFQS